MPLLLKGEYMFVKDFCTFPFRKKQHGYSFYYMYWRDVLFEYASKIFTYKGEISEIIPPKEIETRLLLLGTCGINYISDKLYATNVNLYGITHYFDEFTNYNFTTPLESGAKTIGVDGVLINNNDIRNGMSHIIHAYACQLAHAEVSLICAFVNNRDTVAWTAVSDKMAQTAREYRAKMYEGKIDVCVDKGFATIEQRQLGTEKNKSYQELYDVRNNILNSYLELIGVRRANEKRERLITNEVNANTSLLKLNLANMRDSRIKGLEEVERVFGVKGELVVNVDIDGDGENVNDKKGSGDND